MIGDNGEPSSDKDYSLIPVLSVEEMSPLESDLTRALPEEDPSDLDLDDEEDLDASKQSLAGSERYAASAPVTPFGGVDKKKYKTSSPAVSLLEKSTLWFTSLSSGIHSLFGRLASNVKILKCRISVLQVPKR